jgi:hypothetical protein
MEYTNGKWEAYKTNIVKDEECWTICAGKDGNNGIARTVTDRDVPIAERQANANLIASAPDMYMTLRAVEVSLIDDEYYQHFKPLLLAVRQAINKAEGR